MTPLEGGKFQVSAMGGRRKNCGRRGANVKINTKMRVRHWSDGDDATDTKSRVEMKFA